MKEQSDDNNRRIKCNKILNDQKTHFTLADFDIIAIISQIFKMLIELF